MSQGHVWTAPSRQGIFWRFNTGTTHHFIGSPTYPTSSATLLVCSGGGLHRHAAALVGTAIMLSRDQHGPEDAGHLGGERHGDDLDRAACQQVAQPRILGTSRTFL